MKTQGNTLTKGTETKGLEFTTTILPDSSLNIPKELREVPELEAGSRVHVKLSKSLS